MATQPHPTPPNPPPRPASRIADPPADDATPAVTTQTDQLVRSAEMEKMGVAKWVEEHDERNQPDEQKKQRAVPGVSPTTKDDPGRRP